MGTNGLPTPPAGVVPPVTEAAPSVAAKPKSQALTRRASLTAVASLLDYSVKAGVQLVITPILVTTLGRSLYGIWEMLGRMIGYMAATDGRASEALRLVISQNQTADVVEKRRSIGAALVVWMLMLPLVALVGGGLAWLAPPLTHPPEVLRGMNLGYKRMGLQSATSVVVGGIAVWAVKADFGLPGLGSSWIARDFIVGAVYWLLVRRYLPWFHVAKPTKEAVKGLLSMSVWLAVGDLVSKLLLASDVLVLGWVVSPVAVTTYVLTSYSARIGLGVFVFTAGAAMPGFGGVLGQKQFAKAVQLRRELRTLTWLFTTIVGATVLVWNPSFLHLWVGSKNYAGPVVNLLIVLVISQTAFIRTDSYIIDAALRPRGRVIIGAVTVVATLTLGILFTHLFGILGLCLGMFLGRSIQSIGYPLIVRNCLQNPPKDAAARWAAWRMTFVTALLFVAAMLAGTHVRVSRWYLWAAAVAVTVPLVAVVALFVGATPDTRRMLIRRIRGMVTGLRPKRA